MVQTMTMSPISLLLRTQNVKKFLKEFSLSTKLRKKDQMRFFLPGLNGGFSSCCFNSSLGLF